MLKRNQNLGEIKDLIASQLKFGNGKRYKICLIKINLLTRIINIAEMINGRFALQYLYVLYPYLSIPIKNV